MGRVQRFTGREQLVRRFRPRPQPAGPFHANGEGAPVVDTFTRTVGAGSWGVPDSGNGGAIYTLGGTFSDMSVNGSRGLISLSAANVTRSCYLTHVWLQDTDETYTVQTDKLAVGGKIYLMALGRLQDTANYYRAVVALATDQTIDLTAYAVVANVSTALSGPGGTIVQLPRETHAAATDFKFRVQMVGTTPTVIKLKFWLASTTEPSSWDATFDSDSTPQFQTIGGVGIRAFLDVGASNAPVTVSVDDYNAAAPAAGLTVFGDWAESIANADAWVRTIAAFRSTSESVASSDVLSRIGTSLRTFASGVTSSDAWTRAATTLRSSAESVQSADAWVRATTAVRTLTGAVQSSDGWTRTIGLVRTLAEAVTSFDVVTRTATTLRSTADSVQSGDAWTGVKLIARSFASSVTSSDAWTRGATTIRSLAESVASSDAWTRLGTARRSFSGAVASADDWLTSGGPVVFIGGIPPAIASAVTTVVSAIASRLGPPDGGASSSKPDGVASSSKPGGSASNPKPGD